MDQQVELQKSLIYRALEAIYLPCMTNFFSIQYANSDSAASFFARIFKLTRTLLQMFLEIP